MLNSLLKTKILIATLICCTTLFSENNKNKNYSFKNCKTTDENIALRAYSAPARIAVRGSWDLYTTASFIYWQARQENMELGLISQNNPGGLFGGTADTPFTTSYANHMQLLNPNFTYRPGFQVGLGINFDWDNWDAYAKYTWFHGTIETGVAPLVSLTTITPQPNGQYLYFGQGAANKSYYFQSANQIWNLKMDFLDLSLARGYYSGTKLTVRPFFGARGAWIRQILENVYNGTTSAQNALGPDDNGMHFVKSTDKSLSWGVGPRIGLESNWQLGLGTRLIGNGAGDILYTRYKLQLNETDTAFGSGINFPLFENATVKQTIDYLRPHAEFELGFGWGNYFDNHNWHIDFSATYGFQVFWNQNMFREYTCNVMPAKSIDPNGNLYVHGMNLNATMEF